MLLTREPAAEPTKLEDSRGGTVGRHKAESVRRQETVGPEAGRGTPDRQGQRQPGGEDLRGITKKQRKARYRGPQRTQATGGAGESGR